MKDKEKQSAADRFKERSSRIEEQILETQKRKEQRAFLEELGRRITVVREAKTALEKKDLGAAMAGYRRFMTITARSCDTTIEELGPKHVDATKKTAESLLISSTAFDMLKILDKIPGPEAAEERRTYHRLFVRFTLGQSFQPFAAENLRKYLVYRKSIKNTAEFWATYHQIKRQGFCWVASWALTEPEDLVVLNGLREWRDGVLAIDKRGRALVAVYYSTGRKLAPTLPWFTWMRPTVRSAVLRLAGFLGADRSLS
jgi:hypothetical protein